MSVCLDAFLAREGAYERLIASVVDGMYAHVREQGRDNSLEYRERYRSALGRGMKNQIFPWPAASPAAWPADNMYSHMIGQECDKLVGYRPLPPPPVAVRQHKPFPAAALAPRGEYE